MTIDGEKKRVAQALIFPDGAPDRLCEFADIWLANRGGRKIPEFHDVDPIEMPWALPHLFVVGKDGNGEFRYRLVGEEMQWMIGGHLVGKSPGDVFEPLYAAQVAERWRRVAEGPSICFAVSRHKTVRSREIAASRLIVPTVSQTGEVDRLMGISYFHLGDDYPSALSSEGMDVSVHWVDVGDLP